MKYYRAGRLGDVEHVTWLRERLLDLEPLIRKRGYDFDVLFALTILHDVGYCKMPGADPFDLRIRKAHAVASVKISRGILKKVGFPREKIRKTLWLIQHHDDWAFGKTFEDLELRIFSDLDFSWEASRKGFDVVRKFFRQSRKEFLRTVEEHYQRKQTQNPFFLRKTKQFFLEDLRYWKEKIL